MSRLEGLPVEDALSIQRCQDVLDALLARVELLGRRFPRGVPLYSPGCSDQWVISEGGSWVGGFWSGLWWLRASLSRTPADRHRATELCGLLRHKLDVDSVNRSLIFWYGAAGGAYGFHDAESAALLKEAATRVAATYRHQLQAIPLGTAMGVGVKGRSCIGVDSWASLLALLAHADADAQQNARRHTDTLIAVCGTEHGAFFPEASYSDSGWQLHGEAGAWPRGQAWAMLGLAQAAMLWGEPYLAVALLACRYWLHRWPDGRPAQPGHTMLHDLSATAIAVVAMTTLAPLQVDGADLERCARHQLGAIVRSQYLVFDDPAHTSLRGLFFGGCYSTRPGVIEQVESLWGSYFLACALSQQCGLQVWPDLRKLTT
ncbi:glucuronyl hydrolase [Herbaspirillum rubrisubalbicans]|uniref:glucuronyl hydrolase n=1 Tax=Herbaspirillum rubrisubalbicans TaxID=80842 RepID=UPI0020A0FD24|nr:glucuronyl hydrolase [Herbaspirillum rubrisubalbicans]MCP1575891.1 unsaturated chondroitin disaccharide hydrolase [Herbaspirillum rubrisubalbicans]